MGVYVCYTNHAEADQDDMDTLFAVLTLAGVTFVITVPGSDDIMLNYQSLSHHDALTVRRLTGRPPAPEFEDWARRVGLLDDRNAWRPVPMRVPLLEAVRSLTAVEASR